MRGPANAQTVQLNATNVSSSGAAGVVTIAAAADEYWCIDSVHYGYSIVNAALETLVITINAVVVFTLPIPIPAAAGPSQQAMYEVIFPRGLYTEVVNQAAVVTLLDAVGAIAYVNVTYR